MRINYIDYLKVIALVLMTCFHIQFSNFLFTDYQITYLDNVIGFIARFLFLSLFGVHYSNYTKKSCKKIIKLMCAALLVTISTFFFDADNYIIWGVLHFFTLCALIFKFIPRLIYPLGIISFASLFITLPSLSHNGLLIFGFTNESFSSYDYFPLLPYYCYVFAGVLFRDYIIEQNRLKFDVPNNRLVTFLAANSLYYYLCHVPIILLVHYMLM